MKKTHKTALIVAIPILGALLWLFVGSQAVDNEKPQSNTNISKSQTLLLAENIPESSKKTPINALLEAEEIDPFENEAFKAQLHQIAGQYRESIKYPIDSQPILNPADAREYKEFEQSEVDLPFPDNEGDENPIRISAATDRFQYFQGDSISVRVQISGAPADTFIEVNGVISGFNGDLPIEGVFSPSDPSLTVFNAVFDTTLAPSNLLTQEMLVKLNVTVGDRSLFTTVAFNYAIASAQIIGIQQVYVDGPNLRIPLQLNVFQSGYYYVSGVLEDAQTAQPLIQLQAEQRLQQGNGIISLNAHIAALSAQGSEGPYVLRSLRTYRGAEVGENFDAPASSSQSRFTIQGFPFSNYDNEEYQDEESEERADFLDGLADPEASNTTDQAL